MRRKRTATSVTLLSVVFWCCQHRALFLLVLPSQLNSYWQRSLQKGRISQHFSLSLSVIRNRLCLFSFTKTTASSFLPGFDGDFIRTSLLLWMCGPLSWQVCLNVSDRSQWQTRLRGRSSSHLFQPRPVDGDVNLPWLPALPADFDTSPHIQTFSWPFLSCTPREKRCHPAQRGHATNSWPPLKTVKSLIQDTRLARRTHWL